MFKFIIFFHQIRIVKYNIIILLMCVDYSVMTRYVQKVKFPTTRGRRREILKTILLPLCDRILYTEEN